MDTVHKYQGRESRVVIITAVVNEINDFVNKPNKLGKMPVLAVEVDGYAYHVNNPAQAERDKMKDRILQKYGIPILRIRTNESGEESRLQNKLVEVLNL